MTRFRGNYQQDNENFRNFSRKYPAYERENFNVKFNTNDEYRLIDKAQFTINIKRKTNNIAGLPLPVPVFGANALQCAYQDVLNFSLSPNTTITNFSIGINDTTLPNRSIAEIEYTNGANVDLVEISCNEVPYPLFLAAMSSDDKFELSKVRIGINDSTKIEQFNQKYRIETLTLFGLGKGNNLPVSSAKSPKDFQDGIVDVDGVFAIDKNKTLQVNVFDSGVANFTVTLNMFVAQFSIKGY